MKYVSLIAVLMMSTVALAASGEHGHHDDHVPWQAIGWQAVNLGILLVAIFIMIRKSIVEAFVNRRNEFVARAEKTKSALREAELALAGIKEKLSVLESGESRSVESARREAASVKSAMIKDAEAGAEKIKRDAQLAIGNEISKARAEINEIILTQAMSTATKNLADKAHTNNASQEASFVQQLQQVKA